MKTIKSLLALLAFAISANAQSADTLVNFNAQIDNYDVTNLISPPSKPQIVSVTKFANYLASAGSISVTVNIMDTLTGATLYSGTASIDSSQTQVTTGNLNSGKLTLNYDAARDLVTARFAMKLASNAQTGYDVDVYAGFWRGTAHLQSDLQL